MWVGNISLGWYYVDQENEWDLSFFRGAMGSRIGTSNDEF